MDKENCPVEATLELIGGKYKALILWRLAEGTMRFSQLRKVISGITAKMLTQQLRELEHDGLVARKVYPVVPPRTEYSVTEFGRSLTAVLTEMRNWGKMYLEKESPEAAARSEANCRLH